MPANVTREEFEQRVGILDREVEGEKMVTRHILEQTRRNGDDLAAVKTRLDRVETRLDQVENRLGRVENRLGGVENRLGGVEQKTGSLSQELDGFRRDLPKIVGDVMREVLAERDPKK